MLDLEREVARQREKIDELEETVRQLRGLMRPSTRFKPEWRLTPALSRMLALLASAERVSVQQLMEAAKHYAESYSSRETVRVQMLRLRKKVAVDGVRILTIKGFGYYLDQPSREIVKAALRVADDVEITEKS